MYRIKNYIVWTFKNILICPYLTNRSKVMPILGSKHTIFFYRHFNNHCVAAILGHRWQLNSKKYPFSLFCTIFDIIVAIKTIQASLRDCFWKRVGSDFISSAMTLYLALCLKSLSLKDHPSVYNMYRIKKYIVWTFKNIFICPNRTTRSKVMPILGSTHTIFYYTPL